jgi:hypothetical protein
MPVSNNPKSGGQEIIKTGIFAFDRGEAEIRLKYSH